MSSIRRRDAVAFLVRRHHVFERRVYWVVGQYRSMQRYVAVSSDFETRLSKPICQLAERYPWYGYRRVHALLVAEGWTVSVKRESNGCGDWKGYGCRRGDDLVPRRGYGSEQNSTWALPAMRPHPNHIWSYDFIAVRTVDGVGLRMLKVVGEFTRRPRVRMRPATSAPATCCAFGAVVRAAR